MIALLAALPTTLTLLEASGAASGDGVALGRFCDPHTTLGALVNSSSGALHLLDGPTPHRVLSLAISNVSALCPDPPLFESSAKAAAEPLQHQLGCIVSRHYASLAPGLR